ncbi:uncharacterized protein LOC123481840 isoform X1 [Coregonus clupeaformis]|uniref:uncharacterized protein LOC123481840 isoform X1 n=1 Tax=Coregonus clupeaformis TaxID=59861 RepID=UPI001E1C4F1C|nr:uncharacterized protein LOC123481840 isoform X1 [Coregonus clupeaformis]
MGELLSSTDRKAIQYHVELLSVRAWKFTMVLFVSEAEEKCTSIEQNQLIDRAKSLLVKCGDRHHLLECGNSPSQIPELLKKIDAMVAENCEEFFIPQVYYKLMETTMPREVTELRRMYEDREDRLKQKFKRELKEKEEELKKYKEEKPKEGLMKRTSSSQLLPPSRVSFLEGKEDIFQDWREKFLNTYKTGLMFWPFMQFLNFSLVPLYMRTTFTGCCAFVWATFLCFSRQSGDGTATAALAWMFTPKQGTTTEPEAEKPGPKLDQTGPKLDTEGPKQDSPSPKEETRTPTVKQDDQA